MRKKWPQFPPPMWGEEGSTNPWNTLGRVDAGVMLIWMNLSGVDTRFESTDSGQRSSSRQNLAHRHRRASLKCPLPIHVDRLRHACPENDPSKGTMSELLVCSVTSYVFSMTIPNPISSMHLRVTNLLRNAGVATTIRRGKFSAMGHSMRIRPENAVNVSGLLVSQRVDWIQHCGLSCGVEPEEDPDGN